MSSSARPKALLQIAQQVENLRLDRDVERGRRLVGDDQRRVARQRQRDQRALPQPARQLVRIVADALLRLRDADGLEQLDRALPRGRAPRAMPWTISVSSIWLPIVKTGLSAVIGSWKTSAISAPRIFCISRSSSVRRSRPLNRIAPARNPARAAAPAAGSTAPSPTCRCPTRRRGRASLPRPRGS